MLRSLLLSLSGRRRLRHWVETSPLPGPLTRRFVAGRTLEEGLSACRKLNARSLLVSLDHLGEEVASAAEARFATDSYIEAVESIARLGLQASVSIKLTQLGLDVSPGVCETNVSRLVSRAAALRGFVEIDMESSQYVENTLRIARGMHRRFGCVRSVVQAYLYRSEGDIRALCDEGIPVRLCKGAYREPASVAFRSKSEVDQNYVRLAGVLLEKGVNPALATHDPAMVDHVQRAARTCGRSTSDFEFQMLYGIRRDLQQKLADAGFRLRVYVPYGDAWYAYFMRRLAERPANLLFLARNLLRR